jgi:glycosyltransferase involved in cell wall biosynthesis
MTTNSTHRNFPKVVQMTSVHGALDQRIFKKISRSLARSGRDVTIVACHPQDECVEGVRVHAIPSAKQNRLARMTLTTARIFRAAAASRAQICHFHDPELVPVGLLLKLLGRRVIYDVHEDSPRDILNRDWLPTIVKRPAAALLEALEWVGGRTFDRIVTATPHIASRFPVGKTVVLHNYPPSDEFELFEGGPYAAREDIVAYVGAMSYERGLLQLLDAIEEVNKTKPVKLRLAGRIAPESLADEMHRHQAWRHVDYLGYVDRVGVGDILTKAKVGVVALLPVPNFLPSYPVKLFEYMAAGIPFVASNFPLWRTIAEDVNAGIFVDPTKPIETAKAIAWLLDHPDEAQAMGRRGREAVLTRFSWQPEEEKLLELYQSIDDELARS